MPLIHNQGAILVVGNLVADTIASPVDELPANGTLWIDTLERSLGGNGANTAFAIARLGVATRLLGVTGDDEAGVWIRKQLAEAGVDLAFLETRTGRTAATIALVRRDSSRRFLHHPGTGKQAFDRGIDFTSRAVEGCSHFHLANLFSLPHLRTRAPEILKAAHAAGMTTSLDTGWDSKGEWMPVLKPCLPHLDLLAVNEEEGRQLTGHAAPERFLAVFESAGVLCAAAKLGAAGALISWNGKKLAAPAFAIEARDTTGAGDCWVGGFLAALSHGLDVGEAARVANAVAALSVQQFGSVAGLRNWSETLAWMASCGG
jgi:sugar/nucleoside kinase (ribokinase family)